MMAERGLTVNHTTIFRWVPRYAPEIDRRSHRHLKPTNDSWRIDETYIKVRGQWMYLYRAVDLTGQTLDFLLNETRSARVAQRFFRKGLGRPNRVAPRVITANQNAAYSSAIRDLKDAGLPPDDCERRPVKYLNNIVEHDHWFIKRRVKPGLGFESYPIVWRTHQGYEITYMIRKDKSKALKRERAKPNISSSPDCLD